MQLECLTGASSACSAKAPIFGWWAARKEITMPRRRINPKKKSARKQREADCNSFLDTNHGQAFLHLLDLRQSCPELNPSDALRRRHHFDKSTNSCSFDLSRCSMTALPASIGSWKSSPFPLTAINLSRCTKLTALPDEIGEIKTLNYLNLTGCVRLASLPDAIGGLEALKGLSLVNCTSLSALPDSIDELRALNVLSLAGCSNLILSRGALNGLGALQNLDLSGCVQIGYLHLDRVPNLEYLDASGCRNLRIGPRTILALHKQRLEVKGKVSVREMMRELRDQAKRRRQRRLCDHCGRQGGIDEPRLPVCYCGHRRYCDETCQRAGWAHEHSENCSFGFLTALQIESLQKAEDAHSKGLTREAFYRALRGQILEPTAQALARDLYDKYSSFGFTPSQVDELLAQGVKPWDADAGAVLAALGAGDDSSSVDSTYANSLEG